MNAGANADTRPAVSATEGGREAGAGETQLWFIQLEQAEVEEGVRDTADQGAR